MPINIDTKYIMIDKELIPKTPGTNARNVENAENTENVENVESAEKIRIKSTSTCRG